MVLGAVLVLSSLRATALRNVEAFRSAIVRRDIGWFERTLAPAYVQIVDGTRLPRAAALAQMRRGLARMPSAGLTARMTSLKPEGKGYRATVAFDGTLAAAIDGRTARLHARWKDEQRWALAGGRWTLLSTRVSDYERTIDPV